ncbi:hypothetical protein K2173_014422 [Erythroxylum novogranatense]|uniref:Uncharacterized protein n=1 Tax=Erythroxylum novogranatense TaxID=1862640 RepID=A0AAV8S554_9ROSI|nr:hypothetical protein K2173_014422 [Erythroxylum novogranatense]
MGRLQHVQNEWATGLLSDIHSLTEDTIDEILRLFLADFKDGTLKLKVNNAGVSGIQLDVETWRASGSGQIGTELTSQTYDSAEECENKLLRCQECDRSTRSFTSIVRFSSDCQCFLFHGKASEFVKRMGKRVLGDAENLTEQRVDDVLNQFLEDFKEDSLKPKDGLFSYLHMLCLKQP